MKGATLIPYPLPSLTYAAGGNQSIPLRTLPKTIGGRVAHLVGINFDVQCVPTFSSGTIIVPEQNNCVSSMQIHDGTQMRFNAGGFNALRMFERIENGGQLVPEGDTLGATTVARNWNRFWSAGPLRFDGSPSDFAIPCAALESGEVRVTYSSLAGMDSNMTAFTATIQVQALLILLDEVRIPPFVERSQTNVSAADNILTGRSLIAYLALCDSSAFGSFAAGEVGTIQVDTGHYQLVPSIDAEALGRMYMAVFMQGPFSGNFGDQREATDLNPRYASPASATAVLQALSLGQAGDLQPIVCAPPGCRITKLPLVESALRVRWDGSQASGTILATRILEQNAAVVSTYAAKALNGLGIPDYKGRVKTLSKDDYRGPRPEFMPYVWPTHPPKAA